MPAPETIAAQRPPAEAHARGPHAWIAAEIHVVWRYLRDLGAAAADADDLTQEAFVVALRKELPGDPARRRAFLRRTARHLWLHAHRDRKRHAKKLADAVDRLWDRWDAAGDTEGDGWSEALAKCLPRLTPRVREALRLTYGEGYGRAELALHLGMTEHGARTLLQRARATLRTCIEGFVS